MLNDKQIERLVVLTATGKADLTEAYVASILARDTPLAPVRQAIAKVCAPDFLPLVLDAMPWIAADRFNARDSAADQARDWLAEISAKGREGMRRADIPDAALDELEGQLASFEMMTGGRPRKMVRLKMHDARFNPYAMQ